MSQTPALYPSCGGRCVIEMASVATLESIPLVNDDNGGGVSFLGARGECTWLYRGGLFPCRY